MNDAYIFKCHKGSHLLLDAHVESAKLLQDREKSTGDNLKIHNFLGVFL